MVCNRAVTVLAAVLCLLCALGRVLGDTAQSGFLVLHDHTRRAYPEPERHPPDLPTVEERTPLFGNMPFLRLKPGNELVFGRRWQYAHKGDHAQYGDKGSYFVRSGGKYYHISTRLKDQKLMLDDPTDYLLFDLNVDETTAQTIAALYLPGARIAPMTWPTYQDLRRKVAGDFPKALRDDSDVKLHAPWVEGTAPTNACIVEGVGYDYSRDSIFVYRMEIGPRVFKQWRRNLIQGPRVVDREEFEGYEDSGMPNGRPSYRPDAATAKEARAAYDRMVKFQGVVDARLKVATTPDGM